MDLDEAELAKMLDLSQPSSIILEREECDTDKRVPGSDNESEAHTTSSIAREHEAAWSDAVPKAAKPMAIAEFVNKVTVMRPRDVHDPICAVLDAWTTFLGFHSNSSLRRVCPDCATSTRHFRCYSCRGETELAADFPISLADSTGELYGPRIKGPPALFLLDSSNASLEDERSVRRELLFTALRVHVVAAWNERLSRPLVEIRAVERQ